MTTSDAIIVAAISGGIALVIHFSSRKKIKSEIDLNNAGAKEIEFDQLKELREIVKEDIEERRLLGEYKTLFDDLEEKKARTTKRKCVFVLDDNPMVTLEFEQYFKDSSLIEAKYYNDPDVFIEKANIYDPEIVVIDYFLKSTNADLVIHRLTFKPRVIIISMDRGQEDSVIEKGWMFFYKGEEFYIIKLAKFIIDL